MQVVSPELILGKKVLLRYDIDVALENGKVVEDFKLKAGLTTLKLCLENASKLVLIGHIGRPFETAQDESKGNPPQFSAKPIHQWLQGELGTEIEFIDSLEKAQASDAKIILLENIRFFHGEELGSVYHATCSSKTCDVDFAHKLAVLGDFYVNEAFSSYRPAVSTTILPTLLPHAAGLHFVKEVETLLNVRNNPKKPFVPIMGGAKVEDKLPVIEVLAKRADAILVGGKLVVQIQEKNLNLPGNVMIGKLSEDGFDIAPETAESWNKLIRQSRMIVWNGPLGKFEDPKNDQTKKVADMVLQSNAEVIIGGGDTIAALNQAGLLEKAEEKAFISVGGGAMLKLLADGTLPTIEVLE